MSKLNLAVLFGSRTAEHDVSIVSALQLLENVDRQKYNAFPVYISRTGEWFIGDELKDIKFYRNFNPNAKSLTRVYLPPVPGCGGLYALSQRHSFQKSGKVQAIDCAILAFHGMHGEDGTMQGLFELCDIPYSSVGVTGSGVGMDKIIMKAVFKSMGLPVLPAKYCYRSEWLENCEKVLDDMEQLGEYPYFVKPANLGSSIGINRATDRESLKHAIEVAASYDRRILVELGIDKPLEINCAGLGYGYNCIASVCEQPVGWAEFLSFDDKYTRGSKSKGMQSLSRQIPAPISEKLTVEIQQMTCEIFKMLECKGVVRIDYMINEHTGQVYVNEINTIPGSFAFYLFEPLGLTYTQLIDKLVEFANMALSEKRSSVFAYESELLQKAVLGGGTKRLGALK